MRSCGSVWVATEKSGCAYMAPKTECVKIQMGTLLGTWSLNGNNVDVDGTKDPSSRHSNQLWDDEEED